MLRTSSPAISLRILEDEGHESIDGLLIVGAEAKMSSFETC